MATYDVTVTLNIPLTDQDINDIMYTALTGGVNHWCDEVRAWGQMLGSMASEQISLGGDLLFHVPDEGTFGLTRKDFIKGFSQWIENGGDEYGAVSVDGIDCGMIDSVCADEIIQYALFDEVIFG